MQAPAAEVRGAEGCRARSRGWHFQEKSSENKEGKQKGRAVTVPWTGAGKSSIILWKIGLPKEPLFESWHRVVPVLSVEQLPEVTGAGI